MPLNRIDPGCCQLAGSRLIADGFDQAAQRAPAGQTGDDRQLERADHLTVAFSNYKDLGRVGVDEFAGVGLRPQVVERLAGGAELVVGDHCDDRGDIGGSGAADHQVGH